MGYNRYSGRLAGSSPLARGLRVGGLRESVRGGIIPARAGFTQFRTALSIGIRDHPRSRGVYEMTLLRDALTVGSSPLARGLHTDAPTWLRAKRIIPARAGFTAPPESPPAPRPDHPRSRGVYPIHATASSRSCGSSPLARGLPRLIFRVVDLLSGSSPLARGLRLQRVCRHEVWRIIPARAGFTPPRYPAGHYRTDHPRSRGVYSDVYLDRSDALGSSPLARGLRGRPRRPRAPERIIPARAGFT